MISLAHDRIASEDLVAHLNARGVRTHTRKADHYSGNVLGRWGFHPACACPSRTTTTEAEVAQLLSAVNEIAGDHA